jgi:hypothetical protein
VVRVVTSLAAAALAVAAAGRALEPEPGSSEWALLGLLLGVLAATLAGPGRGPAGAGRALRLATLLVGLAVAAVLAADAAWLLARALLRGGPPSSL